MTASPLRIGFIGAGGNTRLMHLPRLKAIDGVELASVCNRSRESAEKVAREFGIARVEDRWQDIMADDRIDAVVIGTWPDQHSRFTCAALAAGKHVLCEARMARDLAEARAMLAASQARPDRVAQLVPAPFTLKYDQTLQALLADGYLGEILAIRVVATHAKFIDRAAPLSWRQDIRFSGLNTLTMGIWYESLMRWVGQATRVMAMSQVFQKQRRHDGRLMPVQVPDHVDVLAEMACGAQAHMQFSAVTGLQAPGQQVWLFGSEGTLHLDMSVDRLWGGRRGESELRPIDIAPQKAGAWRVEEAFVAAIRGQEPVRLTSFEDGVRYMAFTEAVALSAASRVSVNVPPI